MKSNRIGSIILAGALGGVLGYLISDWLVFKLWEEDIRNDLAEVNPSKEEISAPSATHHVDYSGFLQDKADLADLIQRKGYSSKPALVEGPYILSEEEAHEIAGGREAGWETITYYEQDGTFCDQAEEIIEDMRPLTGPNIHLHFGDMTDDPDVVYVHNPRSGVVYEVLRLNESYSLQVAGIIPKKEEQTPPVEKPVRSRRAAKPKTIVKKEDVDEPNPPAES